MSRLPISVLAGLLLIGCHRDRTGCFEKTGSNVELEVDIPSGIKTLYIHDDINLALHPGEQRIVLKTGKNLVNDIVFEAADDSVLSISNKSSCKWSRSPRNVWVHLYSNVIHRIKKIGYGEITTIGTLNTDRGFHLETQAPGNVHLNLVTSDDLRLVMLSLNNVTLEGSASTLHITTGSGVDGRLYADDFSPNNVSFWHGGSNDIFISPRNTLVGEIINFGSVIVSSNPYLIRVTTRGQGRVIMKPRSGH